MPRTDSLEKTLMLGKIEGRRRRGQQRMRWLDNITDLLNMNWASSGNWWWTGKPGVLQSLGSQKVGHDWVTEQITDECFSLSPHLELCIYMVISFLISFAFCFSSFLSYLYASSYNHFAFCISFSWRWSWSLPPIECHEPPSIVLQSFCLSDLIPWIYMSLPLYNCKEVDLGHNWMV